MWTTLPWTMCPSSVSRTTGLALASLEKKSVFQGYTIMAASYRGVHSYIESAAHGTDAGICTVIKPEVKIISAL